MSSPPWLPWIFQLTGTVTAFALAAVEPGLEQAGAAASVAEADRGRPGGINLQQKTGGLP
jgi:hypothetical protein